MQIIGSRLRSGIISVHNESGEGFKAFTQFRGASRSVARSFGLKELELYGGAVVNPKIEAMMAKLGFQRGVAPVPEALGGGEMEAFFKTFPLD